MLQYADQQPIMINSLISAEYGARQKSSRFRPSFGDPLTPPPTIRKSWTVKLQNRLAFCAVCVFVLCIVVSIVLILANMHKM